MDYYNPQGLDAETLIKRVRVSYQTKEFLKTPTGLAIFERALKDYHKGIKGLEKMAIEQWVGSSEEELLQYRKISNGIATPLKVLFWLDGILNDGQNAEAISKYKDAGII